METDYRDAVEIVCNDQHYKVAFVDNLVRHMGRKDDYHQSVTTCIIRSENPLRYYSGVTVENPHDGYNPAAGRRNAFKRAVKAMWDALPNYSFLIKENGVLELHNNIPLHSFYSGFRKALRDVYDSETIPY